MCLGVGSSADSVDFWNSSAVNKLFIEATNSETKKAIEESKGMETKALAEVGMEEMKEVEKNESVKESMVVGSFSPPSFSLGLTQDSTQSTISQSSPEVVVGHDAVVVHAVPLSSFPGPLPSEKVMQSEVNQEAAPSEPKGKGKREKKLASALMSPFKDRLTNIKGVLTHDENIVSEWLFNLKGDIM